MSTTMLSPEALLPYNLHEDGSPSVQLSQTAHRIDLIQVFRIVQGEVILELGCGQGDCTAVLAEVVGEAGKVVGVDPASLDYGAPYTLGQAQAHMLASAIGSRTTFVQADPNDYLSKSTSSLPKFTSAILAHSPFYFPSPSAFMSTLSRLSAVGIPTLHIAEWSLRGSVPASHPHILAALAQTSLAPHQPDNTSNIRTLLSPKAIVELANQAG